MWLTLVAHMIQFSLDLLISYSIHLYSNKVEVNVVGAQS